MVMSILHITNVLFKVGDNILLNAEFVVLRGAQFGGNRTLLFDQG